MVRRSVERRHRHRPVWPGRRRPRQAQAQQQCGHALRRDDLYGALRARRAPGTPHPHDPDREWRYAPVLQRPRRRPPPQHRRDPCPLVDTRAWGGYVVAPGSTVNGHRYAVDGPALVNPLPAWLRQLLLPPHPTPATVPGPAPVPLRADRYAETVLQRERETVRGASEGRRNAILLASVRAVGRFVAWGDLPRHVVEAAFQAEGEAVGLTPAECRATITSALDWSIRNCRPRPEAA